MNRDWNKWGSQASGSVDGPNNRAHAEQLLGHSTLPVNPFKHMPTFNMILLTSDWNIEC